VTGKAVVVPAVEVGGIPGYKTADE
jgi:hypothetical protein